MATEFQNQPVKDVPTNANFEELKKIIRSQNTDIEKLKTEIANLKAVK